MVIKVVTFCFFGALQCLYALQLWWYSSKRSNSITRHPLQKNKLSVVIPFRNERQHLPKLLASLQQLPEDIKVYWINDHSEDGGGEWLSQHRTMHHELLHNLGEGKKKALHTAIAHIPDEHWILTLDADIELSPFWWRNIQDQFNPECAMIVFPIFMRAGGKWIEVFQQLEFLFFQALTKGSILRQRTQFSNGAHLAFQKKYFNAVNGYASHQHISSGDDQFLLAAFRKNNWKIGWAEIPQDTISITPLSNWKDLLAQRIRWAGKSKALNIPDMKLLAFSTAISNTLALCAYWQLLFEPFQSASLVYSGFIALKLGIEWVVFHTIKNKSSFITLFFLIIYPLWVLIVGLSVLFLKQKWKGRPIQH